MVIAVVMVLVKVRVRAMAMAMAMVAVTVLVIVMVLVLSIVDNCAYEIRGVDGRLLFCTDSGSPSITRILYEEPLRGGGVGHFLGYRSRPCRVHQPCRARVRGGGLSLTNGDELTGTMSYVTTGKRRCLTTVTAIRAPVGVMIDDRDVTKTDDARHRARH